MKFPKIQEAVLIPLAVILPGGLILGTGYTLIQHLRRKGQVAPAPESNDPIAVSSGDEDLPTRP